MVDCRVKTVAVYRDGARDHMGDTFSCVRDSRYTPHTGDTGHYCGHIEDGRYVFEWADGSMTRDGKSVNKDGSPVSATSSTGHLFTLPEPPPLHTLVKAGPKTYTRFADDSTVTSQWQEVGQEDHLFSWAQLFVKADTARSTVETVGVNAEPAAKKVVRDVLMAQGVSLPTSTARHIISEIKGAGLLVSDGSAKSVAKVGDVFRLGVDILPDNVYGIREKDAGKEHNQMTRDPSNGRFRYGSGYTGWGTFHTRKDTNTGSSGSGRWHRDHGTEYEVTSLVGA